MKESDGKLVTLQLLNNLVSHLDNILVKKNLLIKYICLLCHLAVDYKRQLNLNTWDIRMLQNEAKTCGGNVIWIRKMIWKKRR